MREQEVRELYEAYMQVHQPQEEVEHLDEFAPGLQKFVDDATKKGGNILRQIPGVAALSGKGKRTVTAGEQKANIKQNVPLKNSFDPFDAILEHLVAEGYADTNESALAIMANMSEEWRQSIVEGPGGMVMSAASQGKGIVKTQPERGPRPSQSGSAMGRKPVDPSRRLQPPVGATVNRYDSAGKPYTHIQK